MRYSVLSVLVAFLVIASPATACENCRLKDAGYFIGDMTILGNGTIYSWARVEPGGKPHAIGVTFTETALNGLRQDVPETFPRPPGWEYNLRLPEEAMEKSPYDHIGFDWNPRGHIPPGIYDTPHFDIHFYMLPYEERIKIDIVGEELERCRIFPDAKYLPQGYFFAPGSEEPKMGSHWVDKEAAELNGDPFTHSFLFGTYDGRMIFWEPMITKAFLETQPDILIPIKMPAAVQVAGYYPTKYQIKFDPDRKESTVAISEFVWLDAE